METVLIEQSVLNGVATVAFNRPEKRNAMNDDLRNQFVAALESIQNNRSIAALIITGRGKAFCAGGDVAAMANRFSQPSGEVAFRGWQRQQKVHHAQALLHNLSIPTMAAVNGAAAGLGADVAMACDFVLASPDASFAWSYIHRGLIPDGGAMYFLPRRIGLSRAKDLIFTGRRLSADESLRLGIVDRVSSPANLLAEAQVWAEELSRGSRVALALGKATLNQSFELSMEEIFAKGSVAQGICYTSTEHRESVRTFLEKNSPKREEQ